MKFNVDVEVTRFTVKLSNGMRVTIADHGEDATIEIREKDRDLLNGAPSDPDTPRYAPGGSYEFELPHVEDIAVRCNLKDDDEGLHAFGLATIENVRHYH